MPDEWTRGHARLGRLCRSLRDTDFHEWGFVIYRGVYGDDDAWNSFLQCFRDNVHLDLARGNAQRGAFLEQYARWTVIEDSTALDNASKDDIRQHFIGWREGRVVTIPSHPRAMPGDLEPILPRFSYCLYVDHTCLATLGPHLAAKPSDISKPHRPPPPLIAIVIDGDHVPWQDTQEPHHPVNGYTARYLGWRYVDTRYICGLYNDLHFFNLDCDDYRRPPAIAPRGSLLESGCQLGLH